MVNGDHQASPTATEGFHRSLGTGDVQCLAHNDENVEPRQRNIPVPVLVKHEEFAAATLMAYAEHSGDESSTSVLSASNSHSGSKRPREKRSTKSKCPPGLRNGKWTAEEEAFTNMIIYYFKLGRLHVEDGTSLRWYLAKRLNCEAMRVTKKLKGNSSIGKQIFRALEDTEENRRLIQEAADELAVVERAFVDSLTATGIPATTPTNGATVASKRASPHKPTGQLKYPHLEAQKLVVPKIRDSLANSEDAKLLLHFFEEAQDSAGESSSVNVEKKRLFSDVDTSPSTSSSQADSPSAKRQAVDLMDG